MSPDPKTLYAVTGFVFAGLTVWIMMVFRTAKEPWVKAPEAPQEPAKPEETSEDEDEEESAS